jgi:hypothetical protein
MSFIHWGLSTRENYGNIAFSGSFTVLFITYLVRRIYFASKSTTKKEPFSHEEGASGR